MSSSGNRINARCIKERRLNPRWEGDSESGVIQDYNKVNEENHLINWVPALRFPIRKREIIRVMPFYFNRSAAILLNWKSNYFMILIKNSVNLNSIHLIHNNLLVSFTINSLYGYFT